MKTPIIKAGVAAICVLFATCASAGTTMSKDDYNAAKKGIAAETNAAIAKCKALSANAADICMADAKGHEKVARAQLEESYEPSDKTRYDSRVAQGDATYAVAKEKCDDVNGNAREVCVKQAKAAHANALAEAKASRKIDGANKVAMQKTRDANHDAAKDIAAAHKDVADEKRDGQNAVAKEKCDALAGDKKAACLKDAKMAYGKN